MLMSLKAENKEELTFMSKKLKTKTEMFTSKRNHSIKEFGFGF